MVYISAKPPTHQIISIDALLVTVHFWDLFTLRIHMFQYILKIVMILFPLWTRVDRNAPKPCPHNIHKIQLKIPKLYTNYTSNHQKPISTFPEPHEPRKTNKKAWLMKKSLDKMGRDFIPTKSLKQPGALASCSNRGSRLGGDSETAGGLVGSTRSTSSQWLNI